MCSFMDAVYNDEKRIVVVVAANVFFVYYNLGDIPISRAYLKPIFDSVNICSTC